MAFGSSVQATQAVISARAYLNPVGPTMQTICNWSSPDSLTAGASTLLEKSFAGSTSNQLLDLPTIFADYTKPIFVSIVELTKIPIGFKWGFTSGGTRQSCGYANQAGFIQWFANGTDAMVPLYIDNASASTLILGIGVMSN